MRLTPKTGDLIRGAVVTAVVAGTASPAYAYIDPGTGSMLLQVIGAAIAGAMFYFRELRMKVWSLLMRRDTTSTQDGSTSSTNDLPR
jgi:hypothetical protein